MKDNNLYKIVAEYNAKIGRMAISILKNGAPVDYKKLPGEEQKKLVALAAQSYIYLEKEQINNINLKS